MLLNHYKFQTLGGDQYFLTEKPSGWVISWPGGGESKPHTSRAQALFALGGMVDWTRWTSSSLHQLQHLNHGKAI